MNNVHDLGPLLDVLNDFTLTLLAPICDNPHFLPLWSKFKRLLHPDTYDPFMIQAFLSDLDSEYKTLTTEKHILSRKWLSDMSADDSKDNAQTLQPTLTSNVDSCELEKKSGNSTQSSNSLETPESVCSEKEVSMQRLEATKRDLGKDIRSYRSKIEARGHCDEEQSFSKEMPLTLEVKTTKGDSNGNSAGLARLEYTSKEHFKPHVLNKNIDLGAHKHSEIQNDDELELKTPKKLVDMHKTKCPSALEYISKALNDSFPAMATSSLYGKFSVWEPKTSDSSLYLSLALGYFMYLLSDKSTSLALSSLYEKIVIRKIQLSYYENEEQLYQSLSSGLKTIIKEKIAKPGQFKMLQQSFLNLFFGNCYFQEGLVALLKELLAEYIHELDKQTYDLLFGHTDMTLEQLVELVRKPHGDPIEAFVSVFPNLIEGNVEIHYIRSNQIEIVLYNPIKSKAYRQPMFSLTCVENSEFPGKSVYSLLLTKDDVELIERLEIKEIPLSNKEELKGTVYFSLESNSNEGEQEKSTNSLEMKDEKKKEIIETKEAETTKQNETAVKKSPKQTLSFNRDSLLSRAKSISTFMEGHSTQLKGLVKAKVSSEPNKRIQPPSIDSKQLKNQISTTSSNNSSNSSSTPQQPKSILRLPEVGIHHDNLTPSPSSNTYKPYKFNGEGRQDRYYTPDTTSPQITRPLYTPKNLQEYGSPSQNVRVQPIRIPLNELAGKMHGTPQDGRIGKPNVSPTSGLPFEFGRQREGLHATSAGKVGNVSSKNRDTKRAAVEYYGVQRLTNNENIGMNRLDYSPNTRFIGQHWRDDEKENTNAYGFYVNRSVEKLPVEDHKKNLNSDGYLLDDILKRSPKMAAHFQKLLTGEDCH